MEERKPDVKPACLLLIPLLALSAGAFADDPLATDIDEARGLTRQLVQELGSALKAEMAHGGPVQAIAVCKQRAPEIAGALSRQSGAHVGRVSLRTRNPLIGQPDAWEQRQLADFDRRAAAGEKPDTLEHAEIVDEPAGRFFRYMKAIPVQPVCLACHGPEQTLAPAVRERLRADYPKDRATGYSVGEIRGAVTIKKPL